MPTISLSQALSILDEVVASIMRSSSALSPIEILPISKCCRRILASTQFARVDLPAFNKSAMDGYAILGADRIKDEREYRVLEVVAAGAVAAQSLQRGTTVKVMTGAPVPLGAALVVPHEMTTPQGDRIKVLSWPKTNNICLQGEDMKMGEVVAERGCALNSIVIANLVASGIVDVPVYQRMKVTIISTGNEIVDDFAALTDGKIMNSNGPMLGALCEQYGLEVERNVIVADSYEQTGQAIKDALLLSDIVLLSGGVSMGDFDFVAEVLRDLSVTIHFDNVAIKPGKPITFATFSDALAHQKMQKLKKMVFGLPGNPVAVYLTFHLFVLRALRILYGNVPEPAYVNLPLAQDFKRREDTRIAFIPCRLERDGTIFPVTFHGSAHLAALLDCAGFLVVPQGIAQISKGERGQFFMVNI